MSEGKHPIELLLELERRSKQNAKGLPQQTEKKALWSGIGFRAADINLVAPLSQVNEILHYPKLTLVPGAQAWVKGLANIRGTLLPIMDLQGYMGKDAIPLRMQSRILVIHQGELSAGLLVNEVLGLKHFEPESKVAFVKKLDQAIKPYIHGAFEQDGQTWHVFDMAALAQDPLFLRVAV